MRIKKNDNVQVITGKEKGKSGKVLKVLREEDKVLVEKVNVVTKHKKPGRQEPGEIIKIEKPVRASDVMLVCPSCKKPTRVGHRFEEEKKVRFCKKCNKTIE